MAVQSGDRIKASEYNNYVMGLSYTDKFAKSFSDHAGNHPERIYSYDIWMRGSRTDKNDVALPVPYPSYNTFKIYVDRSFSSGVGEFIYVNVYEITWDNGGDEVETLVGGPFYDTSTWGDGTVYHRYWKPGLYRVKIIVPAVWNLFRRNRSAYVEFKPWQNQVETEGHIRTFLGDRSGIADLGYGSEIKAGSAADGLYGDPFYLGGNHPDYVGD